MAPPQRILFPPERIYMDWQQRWRAGAGLHNPGNLCFLNSILQCLTYTPPLANYLLSREHSQSCHQRGFCVMCRMESHVNRVLRSSGSAIYPSAVISVLSLIGEHFQLGMQEDAHEFLRYTVDAMQRACLNGISNLDISSESTTIVHQIFGGFLRSRVTCSSCKAVSDSYEAFLDIPLDIKVREFVIVLRDALCSVSRCNKMVAASKRFTVHRAPRVLTVCLKRFEDFTGRKINKVVKYSSCLDLRPYMSQPDGESLSYSLYAVLVHSGNGCHSGHYFCYIKASNGLWYEMNDSSVDLCDISTVLQQQAYLLFYLSSTLLPLRASHLHPPHLSTFASSAFAALREKLVRNPTWLPDLLSTVGPQAARRATRRGGRIQLLFLLPEERGEGEGLEQLAATGRGFLQLLRGRRGQLLSKEDWSES
uniref:Ubiquitin carboxyl-terminal hydrolase n=1 Tax=Buteo japonicus TaxID=224669 RepID=A0A8B9ZAQ3_9AVES